MCVYLYHMQYKIVELVYLYMLSIEHFYYTITLINMIIQYYIYIII